MNENRGLYSTSDRRRRHRWLRTTGELGQRFECRARENVASLASNTYTAADPASAAMSTRAPPTTSPLANTSRHALSAEPDIDIAVGRHAHRIDDRRPAPKRGLDVRDPLLQRLAAGALNIRSCAHAASSVCAPAARHAR